MAQNLARNCGYAVFPCGANKHPTRPAAEGGEGCKDATTDPECIAWMWRNWPGPLVGIATGAASGISVLDVDRKHPVGIAWWREHCVRLLPTRAYETKSGGLHLYFLHVDGVRNSQGKLCKGIDTRGEGGYILSWFAAGFACHDHSPPAAWPAWVLDELARTPPAPAVVTGEVPTENAIAGIVRCVATAAEGERNAVLFWGACRLAERGIVQAEAMAVLTPAGRAAGLPPSKFKRQSPAHTAAERLQHDEL
jgi:hypothetical protein